MKGSFLSSDWYRVAGLKPRLRNHVEIHRQIFRGGIWYVVQDQHTGKYHRIGQAANYLISQMNGRRTIEELWDATCQRFPDDPPTQPEVIHLLSQLHNADLVAGEVTPDLDEMGRRHYKQSRQALLARIRNPLAMRFPLLDPDRFLDATVWLVRPLFTVWGFLAWLVLVIAGIVLAGMNWEPLTRDIADKVLSAENIVLILLAFPLVKATHEMGHAYAAKVWGGEVHEIGVMVLVLIPVPYVDASASASFPEKRRRAVVGGAGIMVELALAAVAMIFWVNAEPGLLRAFAFNVMLIGGVSTLLFNGNPLLRFDGYFVLADLVEIPNLGTRSNKYFWYLVQRYILGVRDAESPITGRGERPWLFFYTVCAFVYRVFISIAISLFIASKLFFIGIILAAWALANVFVFPVVKGMRYLVTSNALRGQRRRALGISAGLVAVIVWVLFAVPVPYATRAEAVVLMEDQSIIRARTEGFISHVSRSEGQVAPGDLVIRVEDPDLETRARLIQTRREELHLRMDRARARNPVQVASLAEQLVFMDSRLEAIEDRLASLDVRVGVEGTVVVPNSSDLPGMYVDKGQVLGYVIPPVSPRLRVAVSQAVAELVRGRTGAIETRFQRDLSRSIGAKIVSAAPEGLPVAPSLALTTEAGGPFALDPADPTRQRTLQSLFIFDLVLDESIRPMVGERAIIRFDHGTEAIAFRISRGVRQLFLREFNV